MDKAFKDYMRRLVTETMKEMVGYHGTGAQFSDFDDNHLSTGAGSQAFGWGTYVTSSPKIGNDYANMTRKKALLFKGNVVYRQTDDMNENFDNPYRVIYDLLDTFGSYRKALAKVKTLKSYAEPDNERVNKLWDSVIEVLGNSKASDWKFKMEGQLLTVEIPDDNGTNYFPWHKNLNPELIYNIQTQLLQYMTDNGFENTVYTSKLINANRRGSGEDIYMMIQQCLNNKPKEASMFLYSIGYVGIKYKAGTLNGGARAGDTNYVIFNPKDVRIVDRTTKMK